MRERSVKNDMPLSTILVSHSKSGGVEDKYYNVNNEDISELFCAVCVLFVSCLFCFSVAHCLSKRVADTSGERTAWLWKLKQNLSVLVSVVYVKCIHRDNIKIIIY